MRVAHVIHALEPGGAEALLVDLARVAPEAGMRIAVLPLVRETDDRYVRALRDLGVPVPARNLSSRWDPRAFGMALRRLRAWRPDVIHTHLKHADLVGAFVARRLGVPMVSTLHVIEDGLTPALRAKRRLAASARLSTARATITVSDAQRNWYLDAFAGADPGGVRTVPNGVADPYGRVDAAEARARIRAELGCGAADVLVLQVAVARPGKGHATLIDALRRLPGRPIRGDSPPEHDDRAGDGRGRVVVAVAGDGPLLAGLAAAAADLGERVRFLGHRDDVPELLAACDIVAHPSEADALPTALLEAFAAGRPVVTTAVGGIPEIVTSRTGVLVPPGDAGALAAALDALAADPARRARMGAAARDRYTTRFDSRVWAGRLSALYTELLHPERP